MAEVMQEEVTEVVGPKGTHERARTAVRHGGEAGLVTLGGRRVAVQRPRVRTADGSDEVALATYRHFADRDPLTRLVLEQMLAGVSTRRLQRTREPVGTEVEAEASSTSKSAVSREFVARTRENLDALMSRRLDDVRLAVMMIDGIEHQVRPNPRRHEPRSTLESKDTAYAGRRPRRPAITTPGSETSLPSGWVPRQSMNGRPLALGSAGVGAAGEPGAAGG